MTLDDTVARLRNDLRQAGGKHDFVAQALLGIDQHRPAHKRRAIPLWMRKRPLQAEMHFSAGLVLGPASGEIPQGQTRKGAVDLCGRHLRAKLQRAFVLRDRLLEAPLALQNHATVAARLGKPRSKFDRPIDGLQRILCTFVFLEQQVADVAVGDCVAGVSIDDFPETPIGLIVRAVLELEFPETEERVQIAGPHFDRLPEAAPGLVNITALLRQRREMEMRLGQPGVKMSGQRETVGSIFVTVPLPVYQALEKVCFREIVLETNRLLQ